jgi:hypothetical protein
LWFSPADSNLLGMNESMGFLARIESASDDSPQEVPLFLSPIFDWLILLLHPQLTRGGKICLSWRSVSGESGSLETEVTSKQSVFEFPYQTSI